MHLLNFRLIMFYISVRFKINPRFLYQWRENKSAIQTKLQILCLTKTHFSINQMFRPPTSTSATTTRSTNELPGLSKVSDAASPEISSTFRLRSSGQATTNLEPAFTKREPETTRQPDKMKIRKASNAETRFVIDGCNIGSEFFRRSLTEFPSPDLNRFH